jgi:hypothetical protein
MEGTIRYLEEKLGLPVNKEKSRTTRLKEVPFLGFDVPGDPNPSRTTVRSLIEERLTWPVRAVLLEGGGL